MRVATRKRSMEHVVVAPDGAFRCLHCGDLYYLNMPCLLDIWIAVSRVYGRAHKRCTKKESRDEAR